ncbi:MAG: alpha/beta fold hydrolase [Croceibacterium sp.]
MLKSSRALLGSVLLATASVVAVPAFAERPVTDFTAKETMSWATISPDGRKLIAEMEIDGERKLAIMPLDGTGSILSIGMGKGELGQVSWVGNDWLVATVYRKGYWNGHETYLSKVVAFRADGSDMKFIDTREPMEPGASILWVARDGSPNILLEYRETLYTGEPGFFPKVAMVDISTNKFSRVAGEMEGVWDWYADATGTVRVGTGSENGGRKQRLVYRPTGEGLFKEVARASSEELLPAPELFLRDDKALAISRHEGFAAVYEMDLTTMKVGARVFGAQGYDVDDIIRDPINPNGLRGISWIEQNRKYQWFDPKFQTAQQVIDGTFKEGSPALWSSSNDANRHVVYVRRGENQGFYFYDVAAKSIKPIARFGGDAGWGAVTAAKYKARDGLEIEAFVTRPAGKEAKNLPVLVMPHGGPRARDYQVWDVWAQFFADRGYLVIQPNFRGSTGYGEAFERAGLGEWGLKMQDDVDDALAWAVKEGLADPKRACVIGGSYGGYVAMRAAQRNPELYKCAISFAGVSDLKSMMAQDSNSYFGKYARDYWKGQASDLDAVSPLNYPQQFGIPLLLVHGKEDERVPVEHSRKMNAALQKAGKPVEYLEQPKNDHHFTRDEDMHEFLLTAEKFLDKHNPA